MVKLVSVMVQSKCLPTLYFPMTFPTATPIWPAPASRPAATRGDDRASSRLGGVQQLVAFAGAFGGQGGVAAGDQPFAGVVGVADLGQVVGVEQAHLQRSVVGGQCGDRGCA